MGMRARPIGELELQQVDSMERVKCWKCGVRFEVPRAVSRAGCPRCGSLVALHRLKMPMMPSGRSEGGDVIRLPQAAGRTRLPQDCGRPLRMTTLENGPAEERKSLERPEPRQSEREAEEMAGGGFMEQHEDTDPGERFTVRRRVEERRQMFVEASPRMQGMDEGIELQGITLKTLLASVGLATLVLLALIFAIES